jgi:hypothetical protein
VLELLNAIEISSVPVDRAVDSASSPEATAANEAIRRKQVKARDLILRLRLINVGETPIN